MDIRRVPTSVTALIAAAALAAPSAVHAAEAEAPAVSERNAIEIARGDPNAVEAARDNPDLHPSANRADSDGDWEVGFFADDGQLVQVIVDDESGEIQESWTGHQVAWKMARGYEGAFGRTLNSPWVWLPLCAIFVVGLLDWRRPFRLAHLDLVVIVAGFGLSHYFFNRGEIGLSVPLAYPPLLYLAARMLWIGLRGREGLRPTAPALVLAIALVFLVGARVGLNVADSNVIDVGYSGVIGGDKIADGEPLYGDFPPDNVHGDTYGPLAYYVYGPFEQLLPWNGNWDDLPAAHAAAIFFDLATIALLVLLGRRLRSGRPGTTLGIALAFGWAACPYTAFALESNSNDSLVAMLLVATLVVLTSPPARGALLALASLTKFAPIALAPLFATYGPVSATGGAEHGRPRSGAGVRAQATGPVARSAPTIAKFALGFIAATLAVMAQTLLDPGPAEFWERTIGNQAGRDSPFSVWGQEPSLGWLHTTAKVAVAALALGVAFVPRHRNAVTVVALGAAVLIAVQLTVEHWFYLYIPWFLPFLLVALLGDGPSRRPASGPG